MKSQKLICVIDVQNDFIDGSLRNEEAIKVVPNIVKYLEENIENAFLACTLDTHDKNYLLSPEGKKLPVEHCIKGTDGHNINKDVMEVIRKYQELGKAAFIEKPTFGADPNDWERVLNRLYGLSTISEFNFNCDVEFVGFCTDICVVSNALMLKALDTGLNISVIKDLCAGVTPEKHEAALEVMRSCQIEVK